ncbi:MAG: excinuclease ABC subunit UvrC [Bacilli bacterium]|nr:excinuclease ABC subunit UvrC [Bacilli bacterium]
MNIEISNHINSILNTLPNKSGCYLMKDKNNNIIYVGKAKDLKKRVSSYFNRVHNNKTQLLVQEINDIDYVITSNEKESLLLEISLIKKHRPKYNVIFIDDKFYPYIAITKERHPRLKITRNTKNKKAIYFGPYPNAGAAWDTLNILNKLFKLRKCNSLPKKECLYYHLDQCLAPCILSVSEKEYEDIIKEIKTFLNGDIGPVIKNLTIKMNEASDNLNFEKALDYKNIIDSIKITTNKQKIFSKDNRNRDYIGIYHNDDFLIIQIFMVRNGVLIERKYKSIELVDELQNMIDSYLIQYYQNNSIPYEIIMESKYISISIKDILKDSLRIVQKGKHKKMLDMVIENAKNTLEKQYEMVINNESKIKQALKELKDLLNLNNDIERIEAFDNSNIAGTNAIGAMVVYEKGVPIKSEYRKFKIKDITIKDDYHYMEEVIYRRYYRVLVDKLKKCDLIIVDGGKLQVSIAKKVIDSLKLNIKIIGLAKDDKHNTSYIVNDDLESIVLDKKSNLFYFLMNIQDEVHYYAISFHRQLRSKNAYLNIFDDIDGIGSRRAQKLVNKFKNIENMKLATIEELSDILPKVVARELYNKLHSDNNNI